MYAWLSLSFMCLRWLNVTVLILTLMLSSTLCAARIGGNETDRLALIEFKAKINHDPLGILDSWNRTVDFCNWYGVTCSVRHHRVMSLNLGFLGLSGSITPNVGNLSFLRELNLESNKFSGKIPTQVGYLRRLEILNLQNNSISGELPNNISSCSKLISIKLENNSIEAIPAGIGDLARLEKINIGRNNLRGVVPESLGNLSSLRILYLSFNNLTGSIPTTLGRLSNLKVLCLFLNNLSGVFPNAISNISALEALDIGVNHINGRLPSSLNLTGIRLFSIARNNFTGPIPLWISSMLNVQNLQLVENHLTGSVPSLEKLNQLNMFTIAINNLGGNEANELSFFSSLANATNLEVLLIHNNNFVGKLPDKFSNLSTKLWLLYMDRNQISGNIPVGIENLVGLQDFDVSYNALSGIIPSSIGKLQNLQRLVLSWNRLSGSVPSSLGNLTNLNQLTLGRNNLSGNIPVELGKCEKLIRLNLGWNKFSGTIPPQILSISSLSIGLLLGNNQLTGDIPIEVERLKNLGILDVSNNRLSGEIPKSIESCLSLESLNLSRNSLRGSIPSTFRMLRSLAYLDLSSNNLSGSIPAFLETFNLLQVLNLSYNDFDGAVPVRGPFKNASRTALIGNNRLCGGIPEMKLPTCDFHTEKAVLNRATKLVITTISVLLASTALVVCFFLLRSRTKRTESASIFSDQNQLMRVSYQTLLKATNNFSPENLIGEGSFGSVYKGILGDEEKIVAVKVLKLAQRGAFRSFLAECDALKNIKHRNLVKIITACSGVDYHGNDFKALVYEFMENGSLEKWLYSASTSVGQPTERISFLQRLNVAIDIACALEYLHHHCQVPVIHGDLKPSNILLDGDMAAHIGDFGLAKLLATGAPVNSTSQSSSNIGVRGTVGYAPPEYGMAVEVSIYGDIYSYGILLLEMFTGKRPTDDTFKDGLNLHNYVKTSLQDQVRHVVDPILSVENFNLVETSYYNQDSRNARNEKLKIECLVSLFEIGISCSVDVPSERLIMSDVVAQLCSWRNKLVNRNVCY